MAEKKEKKAAQARYVEICKTVIREDDDSDALAILEQDTVSKKIRVRKIAEA